MNRNVNIELARQKGLIVNNDNKDYVIIENLYKYLFEYYLNSRVNIKKFDDEIANSSLDFGVAHPTKSQVGNELNNFVKFSYIYILNDFFVEKLSDEDIKKLKDALSNPKLVPTPELNEIIGRTYLDVIKNNYTSKGYTDDIYNVYYGEFQPGNFVSNDVLALKIFYGKNTKQLSDDEYLKNSNDKKELLSDLKSRLKDEIAEKMNLKVEILDEKIPN